MADNERRDKLNASDPFGGLGSVQDLTRLMLGQPQQGAPPPADAPPTSPVPVQVNRDGRHTTIHFGEHFTVTPTGLEITGRATVEEWRQIGEWLGRLTNVMVWNVADWLNYGEREHGKTLEEAALIVERSVKTLWNWMYVARQIDPSRRRETLSFSHHAAIAGLDSSLQIRFLELAEEEGWSKARLAKAVAEYRGTLPLPDPKKKKQPSARYMLNFIERGVSELTTDPEHVDPRKVTELMTHLEAMRRWFDDVEALVRQVTPEDAADAAQTAPASKDRPVRGGK